MAKYRSIHGEGLKILPPKQILQRLPIALAQVKIKIFIQVSYIEVWFTDLNSKPLEVEDKTNITLIIN